MTYDGTALIAAFRRFARLLLTEYETRQVLEELVAAQTSVLGLAGAGVALASGDRLRTVTATGDGALATERCQEQRQEGPCIDAYRSGRIIAVDDLSACARRWPRFAEVARRHRIGAVAGIPMRLRDNGIGAVDLYGGRVRGWDDADLEVAQVLTDTALGCLVNADKHRRGHELTGQLQQALDSRVLIEQAKGIIAHAHGITPDEAFALIRRHARTRQLRLRTVAQAIVESGLRV